MIEPVEVEGIMKKWATILEELDIACFRFYASTSSSSPGHSSYSKIVLKTGDLGLNGELSLLIARRVAHANNVDLVLRNFTECEDLPPDRRYVFSCVCVRTDEIEPAVQRLKSARKQLDQKLRDGLRTFEELVQG